MASTRRAAQADARCCYSTFGVTNAFAYHIAGYYVEMSSETGSATSTCSTALSACLNIKIAAAGKHLSSVGYQ